MSEELRNESGCEMEMEEYVVFKDTKADGTEIELAIVEEFDFENKHYVVGAIVEGDTIQTDGLYIYRAETTEDGDFVPTKILDEKEFEAVANAYQEM